MPDQELKKQEMCPHMLALIAYCEEKKVFFGGCGCCGSPWLICEACGNKSVDRADEAFEA
jgi:hypothetical protein